jgi:hypothetical protein
MAEDLLRRHRDGRLEVVLGRAGDYFGPRGTSTVAGDAMVPAVIAGRTVRVVGATDVPHSWSYLPDVGRALAMLVDAAPGRPYHLPVAPPCSQQELADAFARAAGRDRARLSALPGPLHRVLALGHPMLRELLGTRYQFTAPFVVDDTRFRREVGAFTPTPLQEAAGATVAWFRARGEPVRHRNAAAGETLTVRTDGTGAARRPGDRTRAPRPARARAPARRGAVHRGRGGPAPPARPAAARAARRRVRAGPAPVWCTDTRASPGTRPASRWSWTPAGRMGGRSSPTSTPSTGATPGRGAPPARRGGGPAPLPPTTSPSPGVPRLVLDLLGR